jgi:FtsZ-interacting cell division protein ZipA
VRKEEKIMGLKEYKKARKESQAFKKIVAKRTLQARRQAYEKEALSVAREKGKALARRKSTSQKLGQLIEKRLSSPAPKRTPTVSKIKPAKRKTKSAKKVTTVKRKPQKKAYTTVKSPAERQEPMKPAGFEGIM